MFPSSTPETAAYETTAAIAALSDRGRQLGKVIHRDDQSLALRKPAGLARDGRDTVRIHQPGGEVREHTPCAGPASS